MDTKICSDCKDKLPATLEFFGSRGKKRGGLASNCRDCHARRNRERRILQRLEAMKHYSDGEPQCECCGELNIEFLAIDHIDGGGHQHRKSGAINIETWLKNNGYPEGFRVLCHNCNCALGFYGYCPHQSKGGRFDEVLSPKYPHSKLYCVNGHPLFGDNISIAPQSKGRGSRRICRTCKRDANRRQRAAKKAADTLLHR